MFKAPNDSDALHHALYVGAQLVHIFATKNHIYTHFDLQNVADLDIYADDFWGASDFTLKNGSIINITSHLYTDARYSLYEQLGLTRQKNIYHIKDILKDGVIKQWADFRSKPLLLISRPRRESSIYVAANPFLVQAGIYINPDFVWQNIVQYLSELKSAAQIPPEVPNDLKITNQGFDVKTSFRPKMKKAK